MKASNVNTFNISESLFPNVIKILPRVYQNKAEIHAADWFAIYRSSSSCKHLFKLNIKVIEDNRITS